MKDSFGRYLVYVAFIVVIGWVAVTMREPSLLWLCVLIIPMELLNFLA